MTTPFNREMGDCILYTFLQLSPREMEKWVRNNLEEFVSKSYTNRELYDFLVTISKIPVARIGKLRVGDISGFMQAASDLIPYYERPNEGGESKLLDREWCEKQLTKSNENPEPDVKA